MKRSEENFKQCSKIMYFMFKKELDFLLCFKKNEHGHIHIAVFKMDNQQDPTV